ncbi:MAG: serine/threonine-protein phosphatase [Paenibacillaceae bacterium]|nr:serine/threonine-protein phosphatase [Paenibacillaceae bacterium]
MNDPRRVLKRRFVWLYAAFGASSVVFMNGYNVWVSGAPWAHVLRVDFKFVLMAHTVLVGALIGFTSFRFAAIRIPPGTWAAASDRDSLRRLLAFPGELATVVLAGSLASTVVYHVLELFVLYLRPYDLMTFRQIAIELVYGLAVSQLFRTAARIMIRPVAERIACSDLQGIAGTTIVRQWLTALASLYTLIVLALLWSVINKDADNGFNRLFATTLVGCCVLFGYFALRTLVAGLLGELRALTRRLRSLLSVVEGKHDTMPILARDETGELAEAFNSLQAHIADGYRQLQEELALAYRVQRHLLPPRTHVCGPFRIACVSTPAGEVGGDVYDVQPLDEGRCAVMIGDVSGKGLPAALVTSAVITLFRTAALGGASPADMMAQLNRELTEALGGDMMVTLGIGVLDSGAASIRYASAGHLAPYTVFAGTAVMHEFHSLPLGIDPDEPYAERTIALRPGEQFVLVTDGIVEAGNAAGEMFGFDGLEAVLRRLDPAAAPEDGIEAIERELPADGPARYADDRTVVIVGRRKEADRNR